MVVRDVTSYNSLGDPLPPKVAHRGVEGVVIEPGNHAVVTPALRVLPRRSPIVIMHFPLRSIEQFRRKVIQGGRAVERNTQLSDDVCATWRVLYRARDEGAIERYYESQVLNDEQVADGLRNGTLVEDPRLRDYLSATRHSTQPS